jgi:galactonate dehydratase
MFQRLLNRRKFLKKLCLLTADLLDYLSNSDVFEYKDGFITIPTRPGLGVEINEDAVIKAPGIGHSWKNPIWCNYDGTMSEW